VIHHALTRVGSMLCAFSIASQEAVAQQPVQTVGKWTEMPYLMPINPVHVGLLHSGKVLIVAGSENNPAVHSQQVSKAALWNLGGGEIADGYITRLRDLVWDVFCNGWAFFPDGRCLVIGGTAQYSPFLGEPRTTVFDPVSERFSQMQTMAHGRWYATATVMSDGRILTFSGLNELGGTNNQVEFYTVGQGWSTPYPANYAPILYPWLHLLPNGKVVNSGGSPQTWTYDPANPTAKWQAIARTSRGLTRVFGSSVLLPLLPSNNYAGRVMILGGGTKAPANATASTEIIDFSQSNPKWASSGNMPSGARVEGNSVLLPTGKVFVQGGSAINEDATTATLGADLFDPATNKWSSPDPGGAGFAKYPRLYHSVALLLPDATVLTAGSNPHSGIYDQHIEIYSPAYLFDASGNLATRPAITGAPAQIDNSTGAPFQVQTPDALNIASVVLIKPGSDTHAFDMEQRLVGLPFTATAGALSVNGPSNPNLAPPGYYLLFVLNQARVPSVAKFVQVVLATQLGDQPPRGQITSPTQDVAIPVGQSVSFAGTATDVDGSVRTYSWFFPEGTPQSSAVPSPGVVTFTSVGTYTSKYVASLTAVDNKGVNDPNPPTRTVTVYSNKLTVTITAPKAGTVITGTMPVTATVAGATGSMNAFRVAVDGEGPPTAASHEVLHHVSWVTGTSSTYNWNTKMQTNGKHTIWVSCTDANNNFGGASEQVTFAN
jgi:hypothetical protein